MDGPMHCFGSWAPPSPMSTSHPPDVIHVMNAPRPSRSSTPMYYCERKRKVKTGEAWEHGYTISIVPVHV